MKKAVLCTLVIVIGVGAAYAQGLPYEMMGRSECAPLRTAGLLGFEEDQGRQARDLEMQYGKDFQAEVAKVQAALNETYAAKIANFLTDEQKEKFEVLMTAEKVHGETIIEANEDCRAKLLELFVAGKEDNGNAKRIEQRLERVPRKEKDLFQIFSLTYDGLAKKEREIRSRQAMATSKFYKDRSKINWTDRKQSTAWREKTDEHRKNQEEEYNKGMLDAFTEEQADVFAKAVEAFKVWQDAIETAKTTYIEAATGVLGEGRARQIKSHERGLASRLRR